MVVNVDLKGRLLTCLSANARSCHLQEKRNAKPKSKSHTDRLLGVANIEPGSAYLNGGSITARPNLDKHVDNVAGMRTALEQIKPDQPLVLQIQRQGQLSFMVLDSE